MADPGWYPDPGGRPDHYRFWDGQSWGLTTTSELPGVAGPGRDGSAGGPRSPRRSRGTRWVLLGTALAVVLVLVAVGALVLRERSRPTAAPSPARSASATGTSGSSGTAPAPSGSPSASPSPGSTATPAVGPSADPRPTATSATVECPIGDPLTRQDHPQDGRVHGGGLSFSPPAGWDGQRRAAALSWAYDVGEADQQVRGTWFTGAAVGAVSVVDASDVRSAAELMMSCTASPFFYTGLASRTDLVDQAGQLEGLPTWTIRSELRTDSAYAGVPGDVVEVVAVDLGSPESFAFFWGTAPLDDTALVAQLDAVARTVRPD